MRKFLEISVQCYSRYKLNERPVSFKIGDKSFKVNELIDKWYGPSHTYWIRAFYGNAILSLNTLPVTLSFQEPLCCNGQLKLMAPGQGQSMTQQPQYQHSSGWRMIGGSPSTGLGIYTSTWQTSTHWLHPIHISGLNMTCVFGVVILGKAFISFWLIIISLFCFIDSSVIHIVSLVIGFHITPIIQG